MKVSYNWLQTYFDKPLPSPEKLAELLTFHVFEIESVEKMTLGAGNGADSTDTVLDVKVLPDRAHYDLAHRGIAAEVAVITGLQKREVTLEPIATTSTKKVSVDNEDTAACPRYMARFVGGVTVADSPEWLKARLEAVGQRSINNIVDAANFVMLDIGQPLHAFDADKVKGGISIRTAKKGEKITTLDGKDIPLDESVLVIADDAGPLAIAGIKGGTRAAVTEATKNLIIESANFNASLIRKTTQKIGIRSDSSKRYENEITPEFAAWGMSEVTKLIADIAEAKEIGEVTDIYPTPHKLWTIEISSGFIGNLLGTVIAEKEIEDIFSQLHISFTKKTSSVYTLTPPLYRLDLMIPEDIVEEIGRIHGYEKIKSAELPTTNFKPIINKTFFYCHKIRETLIAEGFSEVYTYSLQNTGDIEILNPLASDKNHVRKNLSDGIAAALEFNAKNADLLGLDQIKIFEIGKVFTAKGEFTSLCIGVKNTKKLKIKEADVITAALEKIGIAAKQGTASANGSVIEIVLDEILKKMPEPTNTENTESKKQIIKSDKITFQPISPYPFAVRDIAVFVPEEALSAGEKSGVDEIRTLIKKEASDILVRTALFDTFKKESKVSYAFHLVFQSDQKTLTETEINDIMFRVTAAMNAKPGWQVR